MTRRRFSLALAAVLLSLAPLAHAANGLSNTVETKVVNWLFKQEAFGTAPSALYIALHSADPGDTCANEISGGSYARAQLNPDANSSTNTNWNAAGTSGSAATMSNKLAVTFPTASGNWNSGSAIQYFSILDASTSGTCLFSGTIPPSGVVVLNGNTLSFGAGTPGKLAVTID